MSKNYLEAGNNEELHIKLPLFTTGGKGRIAADSSTSFTFREHRAL